MEEESVPLLVLTLLPMKLAPTGVGLAGIMLIICSPERELRRLPLEPEGMLILIALNESSSESALVEDELKLPDE